MKRTTLDHDELFFGHFHKLIRVMQGISLFLVNKLGKPSEKPVLTAMLICILFVFTSRVCAETYKIGTVAWAGYSPANVADVMGFWKSLGIDMKVICYDNNLNMNKALVNGHTDFAINVTGVWIKEHLMGTPVSILAEIDWSRGGDKIVIKKGTDMSTLRGQPVGVFSHWSVMPLLHRHLFSHNLQLSDFGMVELETEALADNFIAGRLKAIVCYDPDAFRAEREGGGEVVATSATYPGSVTDSVVARSDRLAEIPSKDIVSVFKGWVRAVQWIHDKDNWNAFKKILNEKTFPDDPPYSDKELRKILDGVRILNTDALREQNKAGGGLSGYVMEFKAILKANGLLKKDFRPEELLNTAAITEALRSSE